MAGSRRVTIEFLGDDKTASKTARNVDSTTSKLGDTFAKVGKVAAVGLAAGVAVAGKFMYDAAKAAAEDEASQAKLAQTLKKTAGATDEQIASVESWISKQGVALGVTDDELRPALQRLTEATGDVGEAQKLASLAMDVSAGTGKSLESVSIALMKAQNGQVSSLSRLGIETTNAKGETISFEQATKKMADTFGGQAAAQADTLQGRMGRLKLMFDEARESIGAKLLPVLTDLATWFMDDGLPAIKEFASDLQERLRPAMEKAQELFGKVVAYLKENWPEISRVIKEVLTNVVEIVKGVAKLVIAIWDKWGDDIMRVIKIVFPYVVNSVKNALKIIRGVIDVVTGLIKGDWSQVWKGIKEIFGGVWGQITNIVKTALKLLKTLIGSAWDAVKDSTKKAWQAIKDGISNAISGIVDWIKSHWKTIVVGLFTGPLGLVVAWVADRWNLKDKIADVVGRVVDIIKSIPDRLSRLPERMLNLGGRLVGQLLSGIRDSIRGISSWIKDHVVDPIIDAVKHWFGMSSPSKVMKGLGGHVVQGFMDGLSSGNILDVAKKVFGSLPNALIQMVKKGVVSASELSAKALKAIGGPIASGLDTALYGDTLSNQQIGRRLLDAMGWGAYWPQFNALVMGESGWNNYAQNPTSSAYGIGQFLDSTWATVGYAKTSDAGLQIAAMLKYIAQSYGNPAAAYSAWLSRSPHWYGQGLHGAVFDTPTLIGVGDGTRPERVDVTPIGGRRNGNGGITIVVNGALDPNAVAKQVQQMLLKLKRQNGRELGIA